MQAALDAAADRRSSVLMLATAAAAAAASGVPRSMAVCAAWACVNTAAYIVTRARWYHGNKRAAVAVGLRLAWPVVVQAYVATGRRFPVLAPGLAAFWASRVAPPLLVAYDANARLPLPRLRALLAAQAVTLALGQPAACAAIEACWIGTAGTMRDIASTVGRATHAAVAALLGDVSTSPPAPCAARSCEVVMTAMFWSAFVAIDALARAEVAPRARAGAAPAPGATVAAAACGWAALVVADALLPCGALPQRAWGRAACQGPPVLPPILKWLRGGA
jgi:hypothetical protein